MLDLSFWQKRRVLVTGASGFVGRNLTPLLRETGCELITPTRREYDLLEQQDVRRLFADTKPEIVFHLAAQTLVEAGLQVTMLDVGNTDHKYSGLIPDADFVTIRETDREQHRYFIGDDFEGIPAGGTEIGAQLTPPRRFITEQVDKYIPIDSKSFHAMQNG